MQICGPETGMDDASSTLMPVLTLGQPRPSAKGRGKMPAAPRVAPVPRVAVDDEEATRDLSTMVGGYRIGEMLGRGGISVVFAVTHPSPREPSLPLAMKVITDRRLQDDLAYETIYAHAKAVAALASPHIVRTVDAGRLPSREPYVVMEKLGGEDLAAHLARGGALSIADAMRAVMQACDGLAVAHAAGIVHGDIKPGNLVLVTDAAGSCLKIVDFAPSVPSAVVPGNPLVTLSLGYAAPEQLGAHPDVDARADVWALGVVLHELVTGHRPFVGESLSDMVQATKRLPPPMTGARGAAPQGLEQIVHRCLAHDRSHRYGGVTELRSALALLDREQELASVARLRAATTVRRPISIPARGQFVGPSTRAHTLLLATLGPASALVTMILVRVILSVLH